MDEDSKNCISMMYFKGRSRPAYSKNSSNSSRIFHDNARFLNYGNTFMHTLNETYYESSTQTTSSLYILYKDPEEIGCPITLRLAFEP